jgi:hypothetical protein
MVSELVTIYCGRVVSINENGVGLAGRCTEVQVEMSDSDFDSTAPSMRTTLERAEDGEMADELQERGWACFAPDTPVDELIEDEKTADVFEGLRGRADYDLQRLLTDDELRTIHDYMTRRLAAEQATEAEVRRKLSEYVGLCEASDSTPYAVSWDARADYVIAWDIRTGDEIVRRPSKGYGDDRDIDRLLKARKARYARVRVTQVYRTEGEEPITVDWIIEHDIKKASERVPWESDE